MGPRLGYWLAETAFLFGFWLLFVDQFTLHELIVGAAAAALAATGTELVRGTEHPRFLPHWIWLAQAWRLPWRIVHDCGLLVRNLVRGGDGRLVSVPFETGESEARDTARRTLGILYTTLPPNTLVIGIDRQKNTMLLHVLEESS